MAQPLTFRSKSTYQWKLHLSIIDADNDAREAPWYAAWDLVLRDQIFANFCGPPYFTVTYPQFPVSKHIDTYHPADDIIGDDSDDDDDGASGQITLSPSLSHSQTTPPNRNRLIRHGAPSPEPFRGSPSQLMDTPPGPAANSPLPPGKKSTRITDFAQLLYQVRVKSDGTIPYPIEFRKHSLLLIVEVKRCAMLPNLLAFIDILPQTDQQAHRVFTTFPTMQRFGAIIAIGAYWTYVEYDWNNIRPSCSRSEQEDTTYMETLPSLPASAMEFHPILQIFEPHGFAHLESQKLDKGLALVRRRVKDLSGIGMEA